MTEPVRHDVCEVVTLYQGDALAVLPLLDPAGIALVLTDPPYGVSLGLFSERRSQHRPGWFLPGDDDQTIGAAACVWARNHRLPLVVFAHPSRPWPGEWEQHLVWDKGPGAGIGGGKTRPWKPTWELIQTVNVRRYNGPREDGILEDWVSPNLRGDFALHPCQKPVPLLRRIVEKLTLPGDLVLDPFMGSGSTGVACLHAGRRFVGIEVDPEYFAAARRRLSGERPRLAISGPLFDRAPEDTP